MTNPLLVAWKCRSCGCLWRDNFDDSVSLLNVDQKACLDCEQKPTAEACDPVDAKLLYALGLAAGRGENAWRPIATAPKDGSVVIGFDPTRADIDPADEMTRGIEFMRWLDGCWLDPCTHTMKPTHWKPLGEAPARSGDAPSGTITANR